jgi:hypothetical protein
MVTPLATKAAGSIVYATEYNAIIAAINGSRFNYSAIVFQSTTNVYAYDKDGTSLGTTVAIAADCSTLLNAALTSAAGGICLVMKGTYQITSDVSIPANTTLQGAGAYSTVFNATGLRSIQAYATDNVTMRDFGVSGDGRVYHRNASHQRVENVNVTCTKVNTNAGFFYSISSATDTDISYINCKAIDCATQGFFIYGSGTSVIENVTYLNCQALNSGRYDCVASEGGESTVGFNIYGAGGTTTYRNVKYVGCIASFSRRAGFYTEYNSPCIGVEYIGCIAYANGTGADYPPNVMIAGNNHGFFVGSGCLVTGCYSIANVADNPNTHTGFKCNAGGYAKFLNCVDVGSQYGFRFDNVNGASIVSSYVKDNTISGLAMYNCDKVVVDGLEIRTPSSYGVKLGTSVADGSSNCTLKVNVIQPAGSRAVSFYPGRNNVISGTIRTTCDTGMYISSTGVEYLTVRDMTVDMSGTVSTGRGIAIGTSPDVGPIDMHNVTIIDRLSSCQYGIANLSPIYPYLSEIHTRGITSKYYLCGDGSGSTSISDGGTVLHYLPTTPTRVQVTPTVAGEMASVTDSTTAHFHVAIKKHDNSAGTAQTVYWDAKV